MTVQDFLFGDPVIYRGFSGNLFELSLVRERDRPGTRMRIKGLASGVILSERLVARFEAESYFNHIEPFIEEVTQ